MCYADLAMHHVARYVIRPILQDVVILLLQTQDVVVYS